MGSNKIEKNLYANNPTEIEVMKMKEKGWPFEPILPLGEGPGAGPGMPG